MQPMRNHRLSSFSKPDKQAAKMTTDNKRCWGIDFSRITSRKRARRLLGCYLLLFLLPIAPSRSFLQRQQKLLRTTATLKKISPPENTIDSNERYERDDKNLNRRRSLKLLASNKGPRKNKSKVTTKQLSKHHHDNKCDRTLTGKKNKKLSAESVSFNQELSRTLFGEKDCIDSRKNRKYHVPPFETVEEVENLLRKRVCESETNEDYDIFSFNLVLSAWAKQRSMKSAERADKLLQFLLKTADKTKHISADSYSYSNVLNAYAKSGGKRKAALRAEELLQQMELTMRITTDVCHNAVMDCWSVSGDDDAGRRAQILLTKLEENKEKNKKSERSSLPEPTKISYNICLKAWARSENGAIQAHSLLSRMQMNEEKDLHPDKISFSTCIDAYCRGTGNVNHTLAAEEAEKLLFQMEQASPQNPSLRPDVVSYTSVLYSYAKAGVEVDRAMSLINRMKKHAQEGPNTTFLNTLIHLFAKQGKEDHAESLLRSMKETKKADKISYTSVIAAHASLGNATRALALFHELESLYKSSKSEKYLPTERTFTSLLHAFSKSKDVSKTSLDEVDEIIERMHSLYNETRSPELLPSTATYSTIFFLLSKMKDKRVPFRAIQMIQEMKYQQKEKGNVRPDATTYAYLINIFTKTRVREAAERATEYLREVEEGFAAGDDNLRPTKLLYSAVLQAYAKSASIDGAKRAEELLQRTKDLYKQGKIYAKPTTLYYNAVMDGLARSKQGKMGALRAENLLYELEARSRAGDDELSPTCRSYNAAILAWKMSNCTDAPQRAEAILKRMNDRYKAGDKGCRPDQVTINSIIGVWANSRQEGAAERAETYLKFMEELYFKAEDETLKPDSITYNSVIDAYAWCPSGKGAYRAEEVYNRMQQNFLASGDDELQPNIITLTTLTNAWSRSGDQQAESKLKSLRYLMAEQRKEDRQAREVSSTFNGSSIHQS